MPEMQLAFLGTGSAFSLERYNGAVVVDGRFLLDAGAPVLPHMHRLGLDPGRIEAVLLTHFHGDHLLGLPSFLLYRAFHPTGGWLPVLGPPGVRERIEQLCTLAWSDDWPDARGRAGVTYQEAQAEGEVAEIRYQTVKLEHGQMDCRGYRLHLQGRVLAYAGDTTASPPLERLVEGADIAITEATAASESSVHTSWSEAEALAARHPGTRFIFNHIHSGQLNRAATDLRIMDV
ncbi:MAG: ribonuclease Z [Candidatus Dormibacteraeota bacterium]|uniref:Ribonuclease Z n=2 Tax=Candidatus Dormiibacter inghamiae TaxID=3127013 RepID=A0A934KIC1_9BACT|nr:ribonuclease Z [Candidatus Dormibacteraeota bacterium]MBJ7606545.1 ribonuclease Z [Candidatus Dormibacteraeota bacterium]